MMATRRRVLAAAGVLALGVCGCDLGSLAFFMSPEPRELPVIKKLASEDKEKTVKVVILPYVSLDVAQTDFLGADKQLVDAFAEQMNKLCEENQEKVVLVPWLKVKEYLTRRPNWRSDIDPVRVGEDFRADYVIVVDVHALALYEPGSKNMIYRGQADMTVSLIDVNHADQTPEQRDLHFTYPSEARADVVDLDTPAPVFKAKFFAHMGKRLAWHFTPHRKREAYYVD